MRVTIDRGRDRILISYDYLEVELHKDQKYEMHYFLSRTGVILQTEHRILNPNGYMYKIIIEEKRLEKRREERDERQGKYHKYLGSRT